jgi:predicted enzyme related to lactoylglutathione lyase
VKPMPIRYVRDMDQARKFYEAIGLTLDFMSRKPRRGPSPVWAELSGTGGGLALHYIPDDATMSATSLGFESDEPLEDVVERLRAAGYEPASEIVDESFGRSFTIHDPEGLLLQINENDHELQRLPRGPGHGPDQGLRLNEGT